MRIGESSGIPQQRIQSHLNKCFQKIVDNKVRIEVIDSGCYNKQLFHPSIEENLILESIEESGMSFSIDDYQIIYKIFKQKNNNRNYPRISFDDYTNFIK